MYVDRDLMVNRSVDGAGNKAVFTYAIVKRFGQGKVTVRCDRDKGAQGNTLELPSPVSLFNHDAGRVVFIGRDHNAGFRRYSQVPKHMTLSNRCQEKLLWVPAGWVAAKGRV